MAVAPLLRVVDARRVRARFSFPAAGSLWRRRYSLEPRAASIFRQRLPASSGYYYSVRRESFARGETRVSRANVRMEQLHDGSAAKFTEGSCGAAERCIRTAYDVLTSLLAC